MSRSRKCCQSSSSSEAIALDNAVNISRDCGHTRATLGGLGRLPPSCRTGILVAPRQHPRSRKRRTDGNGPPVQLLRASEPVGRSTRIRYISIVTGNENRPMQDMRRNSVPCISAARLRRGPKGVANRPIIRRPGRRFFCSHLRRGRASQIFNDAGCDLELKPADVSYVDADNSA
jgi:hypothetical protein